MRILIPLLFLAACSQPSPQAELAGGEPHLASMTYHCSQDGNVFVRFEFRDGGYQESATEERCDYEEWAAREAVEGPVYSRGFMTHEQWLAMREREG